ncbi:LysR family transcriptional regulator [Shewanella gelidii]|uniref:LysR family transcriptional regulator n=1 Tax=Shewanella gelidii TaxID=1642821 RepID=A0A917JTQ4_9GAMM|nr:LysR family transcriptional regulator [Shewanella gelidii]MCL1098680.1 LysR family transcriptional regulator [Shewanella gelidii]GGI86131.1 LysR family transcriptional regulator [Shewanella gelidii]
MRNEIPNLNLLVVFASVMEHGSLSKAADTLNTNQSTISTMLIRLKNEVGQTLFVRKGRGVVPTTYASSLYLQIQQPISQLRDVFQSFASFEPEVSSRKFVTTAPEHLHWLLLDKFVQVANPNITLELYDPHYDPQYSYESLLTNKFDSLIDIFPLEKPNMMNEKLFESEFVVVCRKSHPRIDGTLSIEQFMDEHHAVLERSQDQLYTLERFAEVDLTKRKVAYHGRSLFSNLLLVSQSEYLAVIPRQMAFEFQDRLQLQIIPAPFPYRKISNYLIWHKKLENDPAHRWFREQLLMITQEIAV